MALTIAYRLMPRDGSGFHLGREGLAQESAEEVFPSDSLFAALLATLAQVAPHEIESFCSASQTDTPPLRVSSVFPYIGDVLLLPLPLMMSRFTSDAAQSKQLKKITFVSSAIFAQLLNGASLDTLLQSGTLVQDKKVLIAQAEAQGLPVVRDHRYWETTSVPRVSLDRVSTASNIYQVARTVFAPEAGLWFMAQVAEAYVGLLDTLVKIIADAGIGGDRSSGYGAFTPLQVKAPDFPTAKLGGQAITLSRYNPTLHEIQNNVLGDGAFYQLIDVGGYLYSTGVAGQRRQRVRMIEAGAVLNTHLVVPIGRLVDVRPRLVGTPAPNTPRPPDHPIYRSGIALLVGLRG